MYSTQMFCFPLGGNWWDSANPLSYKLQSQYMLFSYSVIYCFIIQRVFGGLEDNPVSPFFDSSFSTLCKSMLITLGLLTQWKPKQKFSQEYNAFTCPGLRCTSHTILPFACLTLFSLVMSCRPCLQPSAGLISQIAKWHISIVKLSSCCCSVIGHRSPQGLYFTWGLDLSCGCSGQTTLRCSTSR